MSDSPLLRVPSEQLGWQVPPEQFWPTQSAFITQSFPSAHGGQDPPQSTSVSVPFLIMSPHCAAAHLYVAMSQTLLAQSAPAMHSTQAALSLHTLPPLWLQGVPAIFGVD